MFYGSEYSLNIINLECSTQGEGYKREERNVSTWLSAKDKSRELMATKETKRTLFYVS